MCEYPRNASSAQLLTQPVCFSCHLDRKRFQHASVLADHPPQSRQSVQPVPGNPLANSSLRKTALISVRCHIHLAQNLTPQLLPFRLIQAATHQRRNYREPKFSPLSSPLFVVQSVHLRSLPSTKVYRTLSKSPSRSVVSLLLDCATAQN